MITATLLSLAIAIAEKEGWNAVRNGGVNGNEPTIAYRNHNPGNLRWSPFMLEERDGFAVFLNDGVGFAALVWDIWSKARGNTSTGLDANSTIEQLIHVWAPPHENDTEKYIEFVCNRTGLDRDTKLSALITS